MIAALYWVLICTLLKKLVLAVCVAKLIYLVGRINCGNNVNGTVGYNQNAVYTYG